MVKYTGIIAIGLCMALSSSCRHSKCGPDSHRLVDARVGASQHTAARATGSSWVSAFSTLVIEPAVIVSRDADPHIIRLRASLKRLARRVLRLAYSVRVRPPPRRRGAAHHHGRIAKPPSDQGPVRGQHLHVEFSRPASRSSRRQAALLAVVAPAEDAAGKEKVSSGAYVAMISLRSMHSLGQY